MDATQTIPFFVLELSQQFHYLFLPRIPVMNHPQHHTILPHNICQRVKVQATLQRPQLLAKIINHQLIQFGHTLGLLARPKMWKLSNRMIPRIQPLSQGRLNLHRKLSTHQIHQSRPVLLHLFKQRCFHNGIRTQCQARLTIRQVNLVDKSIWSTSNDIDCTTINCATTTDCATIACATQGRS